MNENLNELFEICGKYNFVFTYKTNEPVNSINVDIDLKTIEVNIIDPNDSKFALVLSNTIIKLKDSFK